MGGCVSSRVQSFNVHHPRNMVTNFKNKEESTNELQNYWHHKPNKIDKENIKNINNVMKKLGI
jgi:hypothetical protein